MSKRSIAQQGVNAIDFSCGLDQSLMGGQVDGVPVKNPRPADGWVPNFLPAAIGEQLIPGHGFEAGGAPGGVRFGLLLSVAAQCALK